LYNIRVSGEAVGGIKDVTVQGLFNSGFIQKRYDKEICNNNVCCRGSALFSGGNGNS
jgi:hypothetical protein